MNRNRLTKLATNSAAVTALAWAAAAPNADAVPINAQYIEDSRCDAIPTQLLTHELGHFTTFPPNEAIQLQALSATFTVCVPNDNLQNDWNVQIINFSTTAWQDLFFVADFGMTIGNADGSVRDVTGAPNILTDAFRIDSAGINNNLLFESMTTDGIFQVGEIWEFNVSNFAGPGGITPPPIARTPGVFAGSDPIIVPPINTASILANPVPEPSTFGALAVAAAALLMRRRPRRRN